MKINSFGLGLLASVVLALGFVSLAPRRADSQAPYVLTAPLGKLNVQGASGQLVITKAVGAQTNQTYLNINVKDKSGNFIPAVPVKLWLSDSAVCAGITATAASGTADIIGTTGANFGALTAKKAFEVESSLSGQIQFGIIDSAKTHFVPCAFTPFAGTVVGPTLATADYK